jgi:hypothetical protein
VGARIVDIAPKLAEITDDVLFAGHRLSYGAADADFSARVTRSRLIE